MTDLENVARKLRHIGFGVKITGDKLTVWESWEPDCLLNLGVKTYKDGLRKRNESIEAQNDLVLLSSKIVNEVSESVFRKANMNQTLKAGDFVRCVITTNPYIPKGAIMKVESVAQVKDVFNVTYKGNPYITHRRCLEKTTYIEPETVTFT